MEIFDWVIVGIIAFGAYRGFVKGFIYQLCVSGALFLAMFLGFKLAHLLTPWLSDLLNYEEATIKWMSFFIIFLGVIIGLYFLAKILTNMADATGLGLPNKIAGAALGGAKLALIISMCIWFYHKADEDAHLITKEERKASFTYHPLLKFAPKLLPMMKEINKNKLIEELNNTVKPTSR
ncbi:MAG: hypothetical protein RIQ89_1328 [Bacteroidota bacterium]|jgi:membrane protein required for colicin V production